MNRSIALIAAILVSTPALAQWGSAPAKKEPAPSAAAPEPAPAPTRRPAAVRHEDDGSSGFAFGVRAAWAIPFGDLNNSDSLSSDVSGQLPLWLEAGWRFTKSIYAGAYFQAGLGFFNNCPPGSDCSTNGLRFGLEGIYNLAPDAGLQPWVGLGFGYETLSVSRAGEDSSYKGWELLHLQVGADWAASKNFSIGPFASFSLFGTYTTQSSSGQDNSISASHNWLQLGLKATYKL